LKKNIIFIITTILMVLALGIIGFPSEARTKSLFAQKPVFSVLGDSISSYSTYNEGFPCYGPGAAYNIDKEKMWWSIYSSESSSQMGWSASTGYAQVTLDDSDFLSFLYQNRINNLDNNGSPDYIAVYGGTNDSNAAKSASLFYSRYNQLVSKLHNLFDGVKLILMAPNYLTSKYDPTSSKNTLVNSYANYISNIADSNEDYFVDLRMRYGEENTVDGLHPSESGQQKIADVVIAALSAKRGEKTTGIDSIRADLDYDHYIIKINAYAPNYDSLNFKFKLTSSSGEVIYDENWSKNNCFYLDEVDPRATYTAVAEIDSNNDGIVDDTMTRNISNLVSKRTGGSVYNGVDYSAVYDFNCYVEHNADLYDAYKNKPYLALEHFVKYGMNEGRQANATFDVVSYRNRYRDLRQLYGWNNLKAYYDHYRLYGKKEGRNALNCPTLQNGVNSFFGVDFSPVYNYNYYIEHNPDVYNAYNGDETQVFIHFLTTGMKEGRRASEGFDVYSYRNQCADLRQVYGWNNLPEYYTHYIKYGYNEGRKAVGCNTLQNPIHSFFGVDFSPVYDYYYYIENNPDVYRALNGDDGAIFGHFLVDGVKEGRRGCEGFDVYSYRNQCADLRQAYGWNNLPEYYMHYVKYGFNEGRQAVGCNTLQNPIHSFFGVDFSPVYDYYYYIEHNSDVRNAFKGDDVATFIHFLTNGCREGRQGSATFNVWAYAKNNPDVANVYFFDLTSYYVHYINWGKKEGRIAI